MSIIIRIQNRILPELNPSRFSRYQDELDETRAISEFIISPKSNPNEIMDAFGVICDDEIINSENDSSQNSNKTSILDFLA